MKITKIIAMATLPCALIAAPAFAQSSATKADDYAKEKAVEEMKDTSKEMASDKVMEKTKDMKDDHTLVIKTSDGVMKVNDDGVKMEDKMMAAEPKKEKADMMDAPATTSVVVACPEGTTAQDDGTCMITGDYAE